LKVLLITSEYPSEAHPTSGIFIKRQVDGLREAGIDVDVFAYRGAKNPFNYLKAWFQVRRRLAEKSYDLIHAQLGNSGVLALPKRLPFVVTYRGSDVMGIVGANGSYTWKGKILQRISRLVAHFADEAMVVAPHMIEKLPKHRSYHVMPSGVDRSVFKPMPQAEARQQLDLPPDIPLVFFPANPANPVKRFALAQAAFDIASQTLPEMQMIKGGNIPAPQMPIYMNACDALMLTSQHEGSPNVVKEAICCNLAIVAVDVGDAHYWIKDLPGCTACPDDQPETIAQGLLDVLSPPRRLQAESVAASLSRELEIQRVIEVYQLALER